MEKLKDAIIFTGILLGIVLVYITVKLPIRQWKSYFSTREGRGILKGIVLAPVVILLIALAMSFFSPAHAHGTWFNESGVFIGLDRTFKQSPQCAANTVDERGTSNLGAWANIWQSSSDRLQVNLKYTHHSCALGRDRHGYDATGIELRWVVWKK